MGGKALALSISLLVCTALLDGCQGLKFGQAKVGQAASTPPEQERQELLKQIDRKFENPKLHYQLGQLYQDDRMWTQAEYHYNATLSFDPVHRGAQGAIVKVLQNRGQRAKAGLAAEFYMNQVCASAEDSLLLGLAFQNQELDEYALACYQQALNLAPNSAKINRQIGYYYLSKGDKGRAQDYLSRSFQLNPNQPEVAGELGRLGIPIVVPRRVEKDTKKLDKIVEEADTKATR